MMILQENSGLKGLTRLDELRAEINGIIEFGRLKPGAFNYPTGAGNTRSTHCG